MLEKTRGPFYKRASRLLCITTEDVVSGEQKLFDMDNIQAGLDHLLQAKGLIGHNALAFDLLVINHLFPHLKDQLKEIPVADTLAMSRELFSRPGAKLLAHDLKKYNDSHFQPHALKSWGRRLGFPKMEDFDCADWATVNYTPLLGEYCMQDVVITTKLFHYLLKKGGNDV
jgi:DNA polymerase III epsilon subunit-like protein